MLYHLRLEDIKDSLSGNMWERHVLAKYDHGRRNLTSRAWVSKMSVVKGRLVRDFVEQYKDWRDAIGNGGRGVYKDFFLDDGIYEVSSPLGWYNVKRYFCEVREGNLTELPKEQAYQCLRRD